MAYKLYDEQNIQNIANAIREKNGKEDKYKASEMANAIKEISSKEDLDDVLTEQEEIIEEINTELAKKPTSENNVKCDTTITSGAFVKTIIKLSNEIFEAKRVNWGNYFNDMENVEIKNSQISLIDSTISNSFEATFLNCHKIDNNIKITNWNKTISTSFFRCFENCTNLETFELSDVEHINSMTITLLYSNLCANCTNLKKATLKNIIHKVSTSNRLRGFSIASAFTNCTSLEEAEINNITGPVNRIILDNLFNGCISLMRIDMHDLDLSNVISFVNMMTNVPITCQIIVNQSGHDFFSTNFPDYTNLVLI